MRRVCLGRGSSRTELLRRKESTAGHRRTEVELVGELEAIAAAAAERLRGRGAPSTRFDPLCEHMFALAEYTEYSFTATEHDCAKPWIVLGTSHQRVTLPDEVDFFDWVHEHWPAPRWSVELDPWHLSRRLRIQGPRDPTR